MNRAHFVVVFGLLLVSATNASAWCCRQNLAVVNGRICGCIVDHTANHGMDRRIWSAALCQRRDLYVYLPPGFDPKQRYPLMIWLHGLGGDEWEFIESGVERIDRLIACGKVPPMIIAIPDGTETGRSGWFSTHSSFLNTRLGCYGDYLMCDVWNFVTANYPIRPERKAHVIAGVSIGGGSAFHHAIKRRDRFGVVFGIFPPLNVRWLDCHGRYFGNFDPCCWGWRQDIRCGCEPIGRFYFIIPVPVRKLVYPLYGRGPGAIAAISRDNPIEMLHTHNVCPGELSMYVAYGGRDEFNIDAQVESFLFVARRRGLKIGVSYDPWGRHNARTAQGFICPITQWLAPQIAPYSPPMALHFDGPLYGW